MQEKLNLCKVKINNKKNKALKRDHQNNKLEIKKPTKTSSESNNSKIISPSTNNMNKNNSIIKPLKGGLAYSKENRYYKKINNGDRFNYTFYHNNSKEDDKFVEKQKIKVKINIKHNSKANAALSHENKRAINSNMCRINQMDKNDKSLLFNSSCLDNMIKQHRRNRQNVHFLSSNSFESADLNINKKNKNMSYLDDNNISYEKKLKILTNTIENLINIRNNIKKEYYAKENAKLENNIVNGNSMNNKIINKYDDLKNGNYLYENKKFYKNKLKKSNNRYEVFNLLNLKLNNNKFSSNEEYNPMNLLSLTQKNINHSNSMKAFDKDISLNSKINIIKRNLKSNKNYSSLYSPPNYLLQTTYQKKLVKNHSIKMDKNEVINKPSKLENLITREDCKNRNYKNSMKNLNNSLINYKSNFMSLSKSNSFNLTRFPENRLVEMENKYNKLNSNLDSIDKKYYHNYSKSILITNFNKEKEDTKYNSEQVSDNNYSTTTSFYYNKNNNNNNINNSLLNNNKRICINNSELHLKNIITSIDYRNSNPNFNNPSNIFKNDRINKNIVLYEIDRNGKLNYKVREINNSLEKIVQNTSNSKKKKRIIDISPKIDQELEQFASIYVKKNQGTVLRKNNNSKNFEYYLISSNSNFVKNKKNNI